MAVFLWHNKRPDHYGSDPVLRGWSYFDVVPFQVIAFSLQPYGNGASSMKNWRAYQYSFVPSCDVLDLCPMPHGHSTLRSDRGWWLFETQPFRDFRYPIHSYDMDHPLKLWGWPNFYLTITGAVNSPHSYDMKHPQ